MGQPVHRHMIVLFSMISTITSSLSTAYFPTSWSSVCTSSINNNTETKRANLFCYLGPNDPVIINLTHLNRFTPYLPDLTVNVTIECSIGGNLSMTWPMKIAGLVGLMVQDCVIYDFMSDWNNQELEGTLDTLQTLSVINSIYLINIPLLFQAITEFKNVSNEWNCGHDTTLRKIIFRSFRFHVDNIGNDIMPYQLPDLSVMDQNAMVNEGFHCTFPHLEYLEESFDEIATSYHFEALKMGDYPNLRCMNYSNSVWSAIPPALNDWHLKYPKLDYMDFSSNQISEVKLRDYRSSVTKTITVLDVRNNNITTIAVQDIKDWIKELSYMFVDIRNNPLDCSCIKQEFIYQVQDEDWFVGDLFKYKYIRNMTCATPPSARGKMLKHLTKDDMGCASPPTDQTIVIVIMAVVAAILIILIILSVRYRKEIKIILYTRFGILIPSEMSDKSDSKIYTAFVSYSSANGDWVHDYLQKNLETPSDNKSYAFKLCLHERDFIGGKSILDNIIYSIENSRHTIVILSKAFLNSIWGMEEFTQAYNESIVKKRRHLILVKLEDIPEDEIPTSLKRCLRTFTYLDIKDNMFLDRLRYSLAIKSKLVRYASLVSIKTQVSIDSGCVHDVNSSELDAHDTTDNAVSIDDVRTDF
ncbi:hypothetical protein SNE40_007563 [Patella caerulea]|uniref:TIR domain-containing protein n=1 Tax=Patella caerulea TaxID=87958 RepID=A0AAN8K029_PATCE